MFIKNLIISGLRKQHIILEELIDHLKTKPNLDADDCYLYGEMTGKVSKNLKALRKIKDQYVHFIESEEKEDSFDTLFEQWTIKSGISPRSNLTVDQIGLYTDFT